MKHKFPMDLKNFKRTASDKHSTTLKHKNGHELKIVHSALSPEHRTLIQALASEEPMKAPKKEIDARDWGGTPAGKESHQHNQHYAHGGGLSGVHKPKYEDKETSRPTEGLGGVDRGKKGQSMTGQYARHAHGQPGGSMSQEAKRRHLEKLQELKSMPKPNLYASGGGVQPEYIKESPDVSATKAITMPIGDEPSAYVPEVAAPSTSNPQSLSNLSEHSSVPEYSEESDTEANVPADEEGKSWHAPMAIAEDAQPAKEEEAPDQIMEVRKIYNDLLRNTGAGRFQNELSPNAGKAFTVDQNGNPVGGEPEVFDSSVWDKAKIEYENRKLDQQQKDTEAATVNAKRAEAGLAPAGQAAPAAQAVQTQIAQQQVAEPTAEQQAPQDPYAANIEAQAKTQESILGRQKYIAEETQRVNEAQMRDTAQAQQNSVETKQKFLNDMQAQMAKTLDEASAVAHDVANGHIDVDKYWNDKTMPQKIRSTIGILLSGMGAASAGQENAAVKYLQSQIHANIEGQKATMHEKGSVLNSLLHQYGNEKDAITAFNIATDSLLQNDLARIASERGDQKSQILAQQAYAELEKNKQALATGLTASRMLYQAVNPQQGNAPGKPGGTSQAQQDEHYGQMQKQMNAIALTQPDTPQGKQAAETAKYLDAHYVPGVGISSKPIDKPIKDQLQEIQKFKYTLNEYKKFVQEHPYFTMLGTADRAKAESLTGQLQQQYRAATDEGQPTAGKMHFITGQVPGADRLLSEYYNMPKIEVLMNKALSDENIIKKQAGFTIKPPITETKRKK